MERIGRNEACPCGSGRKYKRCCLPHEAGRAEFLRSLVELATPLLSRLARYAEAAVRLPLERIARTEFPFWGGRLSKSQGARVVDFLMFECRLNYSARRTIEEFAIEVGPSLTQESRAVLDSWVDAPRKLYRAESWSGGFTTCLDLLAENPAPIAVFEIEETWKPSSGEPFAIRPLPVSDGYFCAGMPIGFDGRSAPDVADAIRRRHLEFVRSQRIVGIDDFLRLSPKALDEEASVNANRSTIVIPGA